MSEPPSLPAKPPTVRVSARPSGQPPMPPMPAKPPPPSAPQARRPTVSPASPMPGSRASVQNAAAQAFAQQQQRQQQAALIRKQQIYAAANPNSNPREQAQQQAALYQQQQAQLLYQQQQQAALYQQQQQAQLLYQQQQQQQLYMQQQKILAQQQAQIQLQRAQLARQSQSQMQLPISSSGEYDGEFVEDDAPTPLSPLRKPLEIPKPVPPKPTPKPTELPVPPKPEPVRPTELPLPPKPQETTLPRKPSVEQPLPVPPKPDILLPPLSPKVVQEVPPKPEITLPLPVPPKPQEVPLPVPPKPQEVPLPVPPKPQEVPLPVPPKPETVPLPVPPKRSLTELPLPLPTTPNKPDLPPSPKLSISSQAHTTDGPPRQESPKRPMRRFTSERFQSKIVTKDSPAGSGPSPSISKRLSTNISGSQIRPLGTGSPPVSEQGGATPPSLPKPPTKAIPGNIPPPPTPVAAPKPPMRLIPVGPTATGAAPSLPSKPAPALPAKPVPALPAKPTQEKVRPLEWPTDKTPFEKPDDPSVIVYDTVDATTPFAKPRIKCATVEKLIEKVTHQKAEPSMQNTFLLTYRSFMTPHQLLELLKQRYSMPLPEGNEASLAAFKAANQKPIQLRVCQFMKSWVQKHSHDFENDAELRENFMSFAINTIKPSYPVGGTLESLMNRQLNGDFDKAKRAQFTSPPPAPILPHIKDGQPLRLLDIHPLEVARQLTLIETEIFRKILPRECMGLAWSKKDAKERAPNILNMINRFNVVGNWVVSEIVRQDTQKQRVDTLSHFIEIAAGCKSINNFNGAMEIIAGLGDAAVHRLKSHWAELSKKTLANYNELKTILSSDSSYKNFRAYLRTCEMPCIPYLGMYLTDLTFIEDGNTDLVGGLVNFSKRNFVANVIQEIQQYQQTPYQLQPVDRITQYLNDVDKGLLDKEQCYQKSIQILPRGQGAATATASNQPVTRTTSAEAANTTTSSSGGSPRTSSLPPTPNAPPSPSTLRDSSSALRSEVDYGEMEHVEGYVFNQPDTADNLLLEASATSNNTSTTPKIQAATLEKLIERVTHRLYPDPQFLDVFLLTYRSFTTGKQLIDLILMRFNMPTPKNSEMMQKFKTEQLLPVQLRVINLLKNWTEKYPYDFMVDKALRDTFLKFASNNHSVHGSKLKRIAKQLKTTISALKEGKKQDSTLGASFRPSSVTPPTPMAFQELDMTINAAAIAAAAAASGSNTANQRATQYLIDHGKIKPDAARTFINRQLLTYHPEEVARQLCIFDSALMSDIQPLEFLNRTWEKAPRQAAQLVRFLRRSQTITQWVVNQVQLDCTGDEEHDISIRAINIAYFIDVAIYSIKYGNYYEVAAVYNALQQPEISAQTLAKEWESLSEKSKALYSQIAITATSFATLEKFRTLIEKSRAVEDPRIPVVTPFLDQLISIEENQPDFIASKANMINVLKRKAVASTINEFLAYRMNSYNLKPDDWFQAYLSDVVPMVANTMDIPFCDQLDTLDPEKVKASIKAQILEDREVRTSICEFLKNMLKDQLDSNPELNVLKQQTEQFKQDMRQETQNIFKQLNQGDTMKQRVTQMISSRFSDESIEEWTSEDQEGFVYGWPDKISVNTIQQNGDSFMIYQQTSFNKSELSLVLRLKSFYEQYSGTENTQVVAYACSIDASVMEIAQQNGVDLILLPRAPVC